MVWVFVTMITAIFLLGLIAGALILTGEKQIKQAFFNKGISFVDLRGYESAENFFNKEIEGMKLSDFIVYSIGKGDLGKVSEKDLRYPDDVNKDYRVFEAKVKKLLNSLPKPVKVSAWSVIIRADSLGIEKVIRGDGSAYQEGNSVPPRERVYDSKIYLDKDLTLELYLECQEVFCNNV